MRARGLSNAQLKAVGLGFVVLASLGTAVVRKGMPDDLADADLTRLTVAVLLEALSWIAFPMYSWLLWSGYTHTRSVGRYGLRLAALAVVAEVPYDLATSGRAWDMSSQNPVFALVVGLIVLAALGHLRLGGTGRGGAGRIALGVAVVVAAILWLVLFNVGLRLGLMPGGVVMLAFVLLYSWLHRRENTMVLAGAVLGAVAGLTPALGLGFVHSRNETVGGARSKYAFYAAYPLVLLGAWFVGLAVPAAAPAALSDASRNYYEIFVGSFRDSDGDGVGDLAGVASKLDYISDDVGADGIWLTPINASPSYHKYDVTDYEAIDPQLGTMQDFDALITAADQRDVRVLMDLVVQHTSSQHPWFLAAIEALESGTDSPYVDYYRFAREPTPGFARYGTSDIWYDAAFSPDMPDLNLSNPAVRGEIAQIVAFWLGKGVAGFRLDATTEFDPTDAAAGLDFLTWLDATCKAVDPDAYLVGEAWTDATTIGGYYASGVDSFFNFPFALVDGRINSALDAKDGAGLAVAVQEWNELIRTKNPAAIDAPFVSNHDNPRPAGYLMRDPQRIKLTAATYLLMPGNPFLYYGEEIGMVGSGSDPNKRMPMVWSRTDMTGTTQPPPGGDYDLSEVVPVDEQLEDPHSVLSFYKAVLDLKRRFPQIARGTYTALTAGDEAVLAARSEYQGEVVYVLENLDEVAHTESTSALGLPSGARIAAHLLAGDDATEPSLEGGSLTLPPHSVVIVR